MNSLSASAARYPLMTCRWRASIELDEPLEKVHIVAPKVEAGSNRRKRLNRLRHAVCGIIHKQLLVIWGASIRRLRGGPSTRRLQAKVLREIMRGQKHLQPAQVHLEASHFGLPEQKIRTGIRAGVVPSPPNSSLFIFPSSLTRPTCNDINELRAA